MATRFAGGNGEVSKILQGNLNQAKAWETPASFAVDAGAANVEPTNDLTKNPNRRAPQTGVRAQELMENPQAAAITEGWMNAFKQSNPGVAFFKESENRARQDNGLPPYT